MKTGKIIKCCVAILIFVAFCFAEKQPARLKFNILHSSDADGVQIFCVVADPVKKKLYAGTYSYDPERKGLLVYDLNDDGTVKGKPRKYSDHPDPMPYPLPPGGWSSVTAIYLDRKHSKLFLGVGVAGVKGFENFTKSLVMYELDETGEPKGKPVAFESGNPNKHIAAITMHPKFNRLYLVGWGGSGVYAIDLDAEGKPVSQSVAYNVPGNGKYSINFNAEGTKVYLGTYPSILQVCDVDTNGAIGNPRSYTVSGGPQEYMLCVLTEKAIFFKGPNNNLSYYPLDSSGNVQQDVVTVENFPVEAVANSDTPNRVIVAASSSFTDAITGKAASDGFILKEIEVTPDGKINIVRESEKFVREKVQCMGSFPSIVVATSHLGWGFLGNRIKGVEIRTTLKSIESDAKLPTAFKTINIGPEQKYFKFIYSQKFNKLYSAGDNSIYVYSPKDTKLVSIPCQELQGPITIDETSNILYAARKDGTIAIRTLDSSGIPSSEGENLQSGVKPITYLVFNNQAKILYVIGSLQKQEPQSPVFCRVPGLTYDIAAAIDTNKGKLYVASQYNKNQNLTIWDISKDGKLLSETPKRYPDGFVSETKRSLIYGMVVDTKRSKMYLSGMLENPGKNEAGIMVFELDEKGEPKGQPKFYPTKNKANSPWDICLSLDRQKLYEVGWGVPQVFVWNLDEKGFLQGEPDVWETTGNGKSQIFPIPDGSAILLGTYPSILEVVPLDKKGNVVGGVHMALSTNKGRINLGFMSSGFSSDWVNL
ncbi:MAG: hypothetical protein ACPL3Q_07220, partial [Candidatus Ratteibacteria bacterium]